MNLFIDTNIFLSFYHLTSDDLEELHKLSVLLKNKDANLYITNQILDEFSRNRESKINDALKGLKDQTLNLQYPALSKGYDEYNILRELQKQFEKVHDSLIINISEDINNNTLKADKVIHSLINKSELIEMSDYIFDRANRRVSIGNPPGKHGGTW